MVGVVTMRIMPVMSGAGPRPVAGPGEGLGDAPPRRRLDASYQASDPVQQRMLELQRDAGNAAVAQLVGQQGGAVPEDPVHVSRPRRSSSRAPPRRQGRVRQAYDQFTRAL